MPTGFKERLISNLREQCPDVTYREAADLVTIVIDVIKERLRRREEVFIEGFGRFRVVRNPEKRRAWKFGRVTTIHAQPYRVVFEEELA